jgi:hypothetical protein
MAPTSTLTAMSMTTMITAGRPMMVAVVLMMMVLTTTGMLVMVVIRGGDMIGGRPHIRDAGLWR